MLEKSEKSYWESSKKFGQTKRTATHPVVEFYCKQRIDYMKSHLNFDSINSTLDVGSGTGFSSYHFPSTVEVIDLDFSFRLLALNPSENKTQASAYSLPFRSNNFDLVYGWNFLHHIDNPEKVIDEMARVTKKYLVIFEPNKNNPIQFLFGMYAKHEHGTLKFDKTRLMKLLKRINFKLISCEHVGWFFAGPTPTFCLNIVKHLPFVYRYGISSVLICEK